MAGLAAGQSSSAPANAGQFEAGEGAPDPTDAELRAATAAARTPADHRDLAEHFATLAQQHLRTAAKHESMAATYRLNPRSDGGRIALAQHCEALAKRFRAMARAANAAADAQRRLVQPG